MTDISIREERRSARGKEAEFRPRSIDERTADVRVVTDTVAMDDGIYQRKRAQEKERLDSWVATRTIHGGGRPGDSLRSNGLMLPEVWDCKPREFMDLVYGRWPFISECHANAIPPQG